jgi:hypothetical protein
MKKSVWAAISLVAVAVLVTLAVVGLSDKKSSTTDNKPKPVVYTVHKSCDLLTESLGRKYSGTDAKKTNIEDKKTDSTVDSHCAYFGSKGLTHLEVRSSLNKLGAESNGYTFKEKNMPKGTQKVSGYGSAAYWDPAVAILNIWKDNTWYAVETGNPVPAQRTLQQAQTLANELHLKN